MFKFFLAQQNLGSRKKMLGNCLRIPHSLSAGLGGIVPRKFAIGAFMFVQRG